MDIRITLQSLSCQIIWFKLKNLGYSLLSLSFGILSLLAWLTKCSQNLVITVSLWCFKWGSSLFTLVPTLSFSLGPVRTPQTPLHSEFRRISCWPSPALREQKLKHSSQTMCPFHIITFFLVRIRVRDLGHIPGRVTFTCCGISGASVKEIEVQRGYLKRCRS